VEGIDGKGCHSHMDRGGPYSVTSGKGKDNPFEKQTPWVAPLCLSDGCYGCVSKIVVNGMWHKNHGH
jgi:hypothetical protein